MNVLLRRTAVGTPGYYRYINDFKKKGKISYFLNRMSFIYEVGS